MELIRKPTLPMFDLGKPESNETTKRADHGGKKGTYSDAYLEYSEGTTFQKTGDYKRAVQCYSKVG